MWSFQRYRSENRRHGRAWQCEKALWTFFWSLGRGGHSPDILNVDHLGMYQVDQVIILGRVAGSEKRPIIERRHRLETGSGYSIWVLVGYAENLASVVHCCGQIRANGRSKLSNCTEPGPASRPVDRLICARCPMVASKKHRRRQSSIRKRKCQIRSRTELEIRGPGRPVQAHASPVHLASLQGTYRDPIPTPKGGYTEPACWWRDATVGRRYSSS
jgi:hypothetical protein